MKCCIQLFLCLVLVVAATNAYYTCASFKTKPSGEHWIHLPSGYHKVYCEMGINGGGYNFLSAVAIARMKSVDLKYLHKNKRDVLLRISKPNGTQPYTVIKQLTNTGGLSLQFSSYRGYTRPVNTALGRYLYLGTLPASHARSKTTQGFSSNDKEVIFLNCDGNPNNYFAFFPNPREHSISPHLENFFNQNGVGVFWRNTAKRPNSGRRMPLKYFLFTEMHYGGCGTYTSSDRWLTAASPALGTAIGLR